jgi:trk system potassium uptake protein TrkH
VSVLALLAVQARDWAVRLLRPTGLSRLRPLGALAGILGGLVIFLLGFILDFIEITFVVVPIVAPVLLMMGVDPISAMSASIASLGSVGPALGEFGPVDNYASLPAAGKWLLQLFMLIGRLELFTVMVLFSIPFWKE